VSSPLQLISYFGEVGPFPVSSVIVAGEHEAVLIDAQFTLADAHRVVALILASGKELTTVYVSHGDPDFYFGLGVIASAFPGVRIVSSEPTLDHITHSVKKKLSTWGPQLGFNGPSNVLLPSVLTEDYIDLEGHRLEICGLSDGAPDRSFVWIPDLAAVVGGVVVYGGLHLFTADTPTSEARAFWARTLDDITALNPKIVVPGHSAPGFPHDVSSVLQSRQYLREFEENVQQTTTGSELIEAMTAAYPQFGLQIALELGAKVAMGEMSW
jgi:glyoxylase-like metal-dependent hydrolase (beta-lactamase superfamily II)